MASRYWLVLAAIIVAAIAGFMFLGSAEPEAPPQIDTADTPAPVPPTPAAVPLESADPMPPASEQPPAPPPEPVIVLPQLDDSDGFVREQADVLSGDAGIDQWLATDQLVRKFTVVVESLAEGKLAQQPLAFLSPPERFSVVRRDGALFMNPEGYRRFDRVATVMTSVDPSQAVALLRLLEPLMEDAYGELGLQDVAVEDRVRKAIEMLLATPEQSGALRLTQPSVYYEFADAELEALAPPQKQLLRMGPENMRRIKAQLREIDLLLQKRARAD